MRSAVLLPLVACGPLGETGEPDGASACLSNASAELHEEIGALVRVRWRQACAGDAWVEYAIDGDDWERSLVRSRAEGEQEQLVVGVPFDADVRVRVAVDVDGDVGRSGVVEAHTGPIPTEVLRPDLLAADPARWEGTGRWLLGSLNTTTPGWQSGVFYAFIVDRRGRVVWARETERQHFTLQARASIDGASLLVDDNTFWSTWDFESESRLLRVTLAGEVVETLGIPDANHPWTELPDGRVAWWGMPGKDEGELRVREADGTWRSLCACQDVFAQLGLDGTCLANTVSYRASDDSYLISLPLQDLVLHLDGPRGEILRLFGQHEQAWAFDPPASGFHLPHGVAFTGTGTLLLSTHASADDPTGVAREYALDEDARLLRQVWTYGEDLGVEAALGGEAQRLPGGNTLHNYGTTPRVKEVTPDGTVVWDLSWGTGHLLGHTSWIEDLWPLLGE